MKLLVRVQQPPAGPYRTMEFEYSQDTKGADIYRELCKVWGSKNFNWSVQGRDIRELMPGASPLVDGALLAISTDISEVASLSSLDDQALFTLSVVHGPDSHLRFPLVRGSWELGRQASLLRIDDPALAPVEGFLEVTGKGVYFSGENSRRRINIGEKFIVGESVLVLDRIGHSPPLFNDPVVQEIDLPASRPKLLVAAIVVLPLILGFIIAWFTQLWFILLMACGSSLLMGLHTFSQGRESASVRRRIRQFAETEEEAITSYRGADKKQTATGIVLGRGTRALRVRGRQREVGRTPEVRGAPYAISLKELSQLLPELPLSSQRLALYQLLAQNQPVYILLQEQDPTWFLRLVDPLLATANARTISPAELNGLGTGFLVCSTLPSSIPDCLLSFPLTVATRREGAAALFPQADIWRDFLLDGVSEEPYVALLAQLAEHRASLCSKNLGAAARHTSQIAAYTRPHLAETDPQESLWATEIFLYLGQLCANQGELQLGLISHGPHFLCAGTTGSGKSQLLRSLIWSAGLNYPPQRLAFILIDFKGGAGLGPLAALPHCSSLISDLDTSQLVRTMKFLRADLTRRKQTWKRLGISSYDDYISLCRAAQTRPDFPELLICIDEFRMLVDDYPEIMKEIMKIATIGRSLGYHLILATQRPQGAVSPDIRANITTSICLRVSSAQESFNVLGVEDAARISARFPGRGFLRATDNELLEFQAPLITGLYQKELLEDCRARFVLGSGESQQLSDYRPLSDAELDATNIAIYRAYREVGQLPTYRPIPAPLTPPSPANIPAPDQPCSLLLGQYEIAELGLQAPFIWSADRGPVLLQGTSSEWMPALRVTLLQALKKGYAVLYLTPSEQRAQDLQCWGKGYPQGLEVFTYQDSNFIQHLLACCADSPGPGQLLIVDTLETLLDTIQRYPAAEAHLQQVLSLSEQPKIQVLCTSVTGIRGKYQQLFEHSLFTCAALENDPFRTHSKDYTIPSTGQFALEGQVVYEASQGKVQAGTFVWAKLDGSPGTAADTGSPPRTSQLKNSYKHWLSWRPLPLICSSNALSATPKPHAGALACGVFKDGSTAFTPALRGGFISISGPQGSGKTSLIKTLIQANPEHLFILISSDADTTTEDISQALARSEGLGTRPILLVDDLDKLSHDLQQTVLSMKDKFESVVVSYTPWPRWNTSPILAALKGTSTGIVLNPHDGADMSFYPGVALPLDLKTHGQIPPGRGVIIDHTTVRAFQAALPEGPATGKKTSDAPEQSG